MWWPECVVARVCGGYSVRWPECVVAGVCGG